MNKDQIDKLLEPRYEVIATDTSGDLYVGDILKNLYGKGVFYGSIANTGFSECILEDFPHLFKKLEWWERRKADEMPAYLKCRYPVWEFKEGDVFKVTDWYNLDEFKVRINHQLFFVSNFHPATEDQYNALKKS